MDATKKSNLEKRGWKVGTVRELLDLSAGEERFIEIKLALARRLSELRKGRHFSQEEVAKRIGSSQSRVAKMEAGDRSVSVDLLLRSLLALGATGKDLGKVLSASSDGPRPSRSRTHRSKLHAAS